MTDSQDPAARAAERAAERLFKRYGDVRPRDSFELALLHAALDAVTEAKPAIEARVRAEVAEEIAVKIEASADEGDEKATEHLGRPVFSRTGQIMRRAAAMARECAGSSPDTTPERCGICGGHLFASGCERYCDTTPEAKP